MKTSKLFKSVLSLTLVAGFSAGSFGLTFDYDTHGGAIESDPLFYDAGNNVYTPVTPPLYCDSSNGIDTCDHGVGNVQFHPQGSDLLIGPTGAITFLPGFISKGLHFEQDPSTPEQEFPGVCWGTPGTDSPDPSMPPFNGVSGEVFGGFTGTVEVNGDPELFGILTHFNRDIEINYYDTPVGFDTKINWFLHLEKDGSPVTHKKFVYNLHFYETLNNQSPCPRASTYGDINVTFVHEFQNPGNTHTHTFHADGASDDPKSVDGLGCDDATSFEPVPGESDSDWFRYNRHVYRIVVHGFYKGDPDTGECDMGHPYPINTLWSEEQEESVGCVLFNIEQIEGCNPRFWRFVGVSSKTYQSCLRDYGCTCPGFMCCIEPFQQPLREKWGIDPNTDFDEAFDITNNCTGNLTLMKALNKWYPYGGYIHSVTALLNAMNLDNYYYTVDQVKGFVQDRCADGSLSKSELKELRDLFAPFNWANNCPLDKIECDAPVCNRMGYFGGP